MYIKALDVPQSRLKAPILKYLSELKEFCHENINDFIGCCLIACKVNFVYDFCQRGSLQVSHTNDYMLMLSLILLIKINIIKIIIIEQNLQF